MRKYVTEWQGGGYVISEIDWNSAIDSNVAFFHHPIEDAEQDICNEQAVNLLLKKIKSNQNGGFVLNNILTVDEEDIEFIYNQLRLRREYFMDEMERQSKLDDANEVLICVNGIKRLNRVIISILMK